MPTRIDALALAILLLFPVAAPAQHLVADIRIGQGPVSGHLYLGEPYGPSAHVIVGARRAAPDDYHRRPAYREIVVYRAHRGHHWWRDHDYRAVRVWYDADRDCYYDGDDDRRGLRQAVLYQRDGRYYRDDGDDDRWAHDDDRRRHDRNDHDHD